MSKTAKEYREVQGLVKRLSNNPHMLSVAIVQMIEREKVHVINRYRTAHNEPELPTDPPYINGVQVREWIIDVPREWVSQTGVKYNA